MKQPTILMTLFILGLILIACSKDQEATPSCKGSIKASFSAGSTVCTAPCPLVFTNSSTGANSYQWNFGDNTTSSEASPSHSFKEPGKYTVRLIATGNQGCQDTTFQEITVDNQPCKSSLKASFSVGSTVCPTPCPLTFANNSTGANSYHWDFGDNTTSIEASPSHSFINPGKYTVRLIATGNQGCQDTTFQEITVHENSSSITFKKVFGGTNDDLGTSAQQTADGGYILVGETRSEGKGDYDLYLIKTTETGALSWKKTFGGTGTELGRIVQQIPGGGYIMAGSADSPGIGGGAYLVRTDNTGNLVWQKTFGLGLESALSLQQTTDNGFILSGFHSNAGTLWYDFALVKTDNTGIVQWQQIYAKEDPQIGFSVQQTSDGGYIIAGNTWKALELNSNDIYLIKTDDRGNQVWAKTLLPGGKNDKAYSIQQTTDGGYIICGVTESEGAGQGDAYLIKTDNAGNLVWKKTFGGLHNDGAQSVQQTADGGYIFLGYTTPEANGPWDLLLVKTDSAGNLTWQRTFGGAKSESPGSVRQTADGGFILLGSTDSEGAGQRDFYLIKTDKDGNVR